MALREKMKAYARARAEGASRLEAGAMAGYSGAGLKVAVCRIEARPDVQAEIRRLKKSEGAVAPDSADEGGTPPWEMKDSYASPLELIDDVMNNPLAPKSLRYQAAKDALPYCHARKEGGKKDDAKEKANEAGKGKFKITKRPGLRQQLN